MTITIKIGDRVTVPPVSRIHPEKTNKDAEREPDRHGVITGFFGAPKQAIVQMGKYKETFFAKDLAQYDHAHSCNILCR